MIRSEDIYEAIARTANAFTGFAVTARFTGGVFFLGGFLDILLLTFMACTAFMCRGTGLFGFDSNRVGVFMRYGSTGNGGHRRYDERHHHNHADPFPHSHGLQYSP